MIYEVHSEAGIMVEGVRQGPQLQMGKTSGSGGGSRTGGVSSAHSSAPAVMSSRVQSVDVVSSALLPGAGEIAESGPPVDTDRVRAVRQGLRDGTYQVSPEKIAEKMVAWDQDIAND